MKRAWGDFSGKTEAGGDQNDRPPKKSKYQPPFPRMTGYPPQRTGEVIRTIFDSKCKDAAAEAAGSEDLLGPFEDADDIIDTCNTWSYNELKQPQGAFDMCFSGIKQQIKKRGEQRVVQCSGYKAFSSTNKMMYACTCKFLFEHADDEKYYLVHANFDHHENCERLGTKKGRNKRNIPQDYFYLAKQMKRMGYDTGEINAGLKKLAEDDKVDVTWDWNALDYRLKQGWF
jgi:hypothetical protein